MKFSLLLFLLVSSAVAFGEAAKNADAVVPAGSGSAVASGPDTAMPGGLGDLDHSKTTDNSGSNRVCLKIRAFIFETDDDRVPKFVRETTCPPVSASAKKINQYAEPRLLPATGGSHF